MSVSRRRKKFIVAHREGDQNIEEGTIGACGEIKRPNGSQTNALKNIKITGSDWSKIEGRGNVRRGGKKVNKRVRGIK